MTNNGLDFLQKEEGYKLTVYPDSRELPTVGTGHLITSTDLKKWNLTPDTVIGKTITKKEAADLLNSDLDRFEKTVKDTIKVPLKPHEKDALISFAFNVGEGAFKTSSLAKRVNAKANATDIIKAFSLYHTPNLQKRRAREARLFLTGKYSNSLTPSELNTYFIS